MAIYLSQTSPSQWKYISEGGTTIVFSYHAQAHPILTGKVLRLRKTSPEGQGAPRPVSDDKLIVAFQQQVISRLLDPSYLADLQIVLLEADWVEAFSMHHESFRPQERRRTSMIDCSRCTAVLAPDLIGGLSCAVEVKPKWGFLPNSIHLSPESKPIKTRTCRTCMHAYLKHAEGMNAATQYCPLDLFSGSRERLETALEGLWNAWVQSNGSINNLRIFSHGKMVLPNDDLSLQAWSQENFSLPAGAPLTSIKLNLFSTLLPQVLRSPVLNHISALQHSLDPLDCEGLARLVEASPSADLTQPTIEDWVSFIDTFLSSEHQKYSDFSPSNLRYHMLAYMLSATFKDCSLIIPLHPSYQVDIENGGIKVIDLDIKGVDRIHKWLELDDKIVKEYAKLERRMRKTCVEECSKYFR
ncbi:inositol-pentakisphosphate 2-kinase [Russula compacta]|nr:inositol-pentakisphosphate 2-kinase [Russula compacta]